MAYVQCSLFCMEPVYPKTIIHGVKKSGWSSHSCHYQWLCSPSKDLGHLTPEVS